jgi:FkbM family methyltransferase
MNIRTVIDIGANVGQFARYIRALLPEANMICFEPLPAPFAELDRWAESLGDSRVQAVNLALGDHDASIDMFEHLDLSPSSSLLRATPVHHAHYPLSRRDSRVTVQMTTLDTYLAETVASLEPEILVKLDVQGYEDRVIRGASRTLKAARACISEIDFDRLFEEQCMFKEVWELLSGYGFSYVGNLEQVHAVDGHAIFADAVFVKSTGAPE